MGSHACSPTATPLRPTCPWGSPRKCAAHTPSDAHGDVRRSNLNLVMGLCSHYVDGKVWSSVCAESQGSCGPGCCARRRQNCTCACLARGGGGGGRGPITVPRPPKHAVRGQTLATHRSQHIQGALLQCPRAAGSECASSWCCSGGTPRTLFPERRTCRPGWPVLNSQGPGSGGTAHAPGKGTKAAISGAGAGLETAVFELRGGAGGGRGRSSTPSSHGDTF
jgi:hypothetical protein